MDKSYVSIEQQVCYICGQTFDTGSILLNRRLNNSMERNTVTGMGTCPECQEKKTDGYLALVEAYPTKSTPSYDGTLKQREAYRTGRVIWLRRTAAAKVFNVAIDDKYDMVFIDQEAYDKLETMSKESTTREV